jgi:hypothetical protein
MADIRISALPQSGGQRQPVQDRVTAQRQDYGFQAADTGSELTGLIRGLSALNPALAAHNDAAIQSEADAARKAGIVEANRMDMSTVAAEELAGRPLPSSVPPAFDNAYREGLKSVLGDRAGANIKSQMLTEYNEKKDTEGFSFGGFLDNFRANAMGGFVDPLMAAKVGQHINQMEVGLRDNFERNRLERQEEAVTSAFTQVVADRLSPTMNAAELYDTYHSQVLPEALRINKSPKDAVRFLFDRVNQMSDQVGGSPAMYDAFEKMDAEGMTLASRNPEVAKQVATARASAQAQLDRHMLEAGEVNVFKSLVGLDTQAARDPASITPELLSGMIGKFNVFPHAEAAMGYYRKVQADRAKANGVAGLEEAFQGRFAGSLPPDAQKDLMEAKFGPAVQAMFKAAAGNDPATNAQIPAMAEDIVKRLTWHGFTEPMPQLQRYIERLGSQLPSKEGPSNAFKAAATIYKGLAGNHLVRGAYFKNDVSDLMDEYTAAVTEGGDPMAAYQQAYTAISPEAKKAAEAMSKDPAFVKKTKEAVDEAIGSSWWPQLLGGKGRPTNADGAEMDARLAATQYKRRHPNASVDQLADYAKRHIETNYIHDETSRTLVKVPPQMATPAAQEALTEYSKLLIDAYRLDSGMPGDWRVQYTPEDREGTMSVALVNSSGGTHLIGSQKIEQIIAAQNYEKTIDHTPGPNGEPSEAMRFDEVKRQLRSGTVDPVYLQENRRVIDKARMLKLLPARDLKAIDKLSLDATLKQLKEVPKMSFGEPDFSTLAAAPTGRVRVDNKMTASIAQSFALAPPGQMGTASAQLAASLITMGEAVVLQASPDPAKGAGMNIGSGYNLKANEKTVRADLKRARVPESQIDGVLNGTRQLTKDHVMRLTQIAIPRYEEQARKTADATAPGLWNRMTTQQKAVMIDVAYQVGNVDQFKKAWAALASGDTAGFAREAQTTYVNQSGEHVVDKRRNSLRASMLQGLPNWNATVTKYGSYPSNAVDVATLNNK